jgi:hypothetical protein
MTNQSQGDYIRVTISNIYKGALFADVGNKTSSKAKLCRCCYVKAVFKHQLL